MTEKPKTPREKAHHSVRHVFSGALARYYKDHPEQLWDSARLEAATDFMMKLMLEVLLVIDEFDRTCTGSLNRRRSDLEEK